MSLAATFDKLGQSVIPKIGLAVFPDTMTIKAESASSQGAGGGRIKGTATDAYTSVPVSYEPTQAGKRITSGDKPISGQQYTLTMPTHQSGSRINLDPKIHRLIVNSRGNEPAKTFRIIAVGDISGVVFEVICEKEG